MYLTIGNIPKALRRKPSWCAYVLLGYLPTSRLLCIKNKAARRRALANLFHACMGRILQPIQEPGEHGVPLASGDGTIHRCHPIFATFMGNYFEQMLATCCKFGECATCKVSKDNLGANTPFPVHDYNAILDALNYEEGCPTVFAKACHAVNIKPIYHPFWVDLPYANIYQSITSDLLHQLYQGIVKHLVSWLVHAYRAQEIEEHCRQMPHNHNVRHFSKGISTLTQVTGHEHHDMCRILLGLIINLQLPGTMHHLSV